MNARTKTLLRGALSITQAAALLGVTRNTAYLAIVAGKLDAVLVGSTWIVMREDVLALAHARTRQPPGGTRPSAVPGASKEQPHS